MPVQKIAIDTLELPRVDLIKLDIEGMEMDALAGAAQTVERCQPIVLVETDKVDARGTARLAGAARVRGGRRRRSICSPSTAPTRR